MTRVIGGQARGQRLQVPGSGTRPTSDRVRESLFASVESVLLGRGERWVDVAFCDAYAGSGAIALEAWSRGAYRVCAIEKNRAAAKVIETNVDRLDAGQEVVVLARGVAETFAGSPPSGGFDVMFVDPPYEVSPEVIATQLTAAAGHGWLRPDAVVVVERSTRDHRDPFPQGEAFGQVKQRRYGETTLWYGHFNADQGDAR